MPECAHIHYNALFNGTDVYKENFTHCCYNMIEDKAFYTHKLVQSELRITLLFCACFYIRKEDSAYLL